MRIDYERMAEFDSGVRELAKRLGFWVLQIAINDTEMGENKVTVEISVQQAKLASKDKE